VSRDPLLYLDDLIASAEKIGRLVVGHDLEDFVADEAAFDAVLFNLQVMGQAVKKLPDDLRDRLSPVHRSAPARMRDLIAHHYFALDPDIIWEVANLHVPALLLEARDLRAGLEGADVV
jgi:uncharacterized protein with HEPN domain